MSRIYLDTNALWRIRELQELCRRARSANYVVVVPALVCAERLAQLRRKLGASFRAQEFRDFLATNGIAVEDFDFGWAERASAALAARFTTKEKWDAAKRDALSGRTPASTDFYIGAPLADETHPIVSDDTGHEFRSLGVRRITYEEAFALFAEDPS